MISRLRVAIARARLRGAGRPRDLRRWGGAGLAVVLVAVIAFVLTRGGDGTPGIPVFAGSLADPVPYDGRSPALAPGETERVLVQLPRPALGARRDAAGLSPARQRAYVASLRDEAESLISALGASDVRLREVVTFERTFHGFAATVSEDDLPELASIGVRIRENRRFFPAFSEPVPADQGARPPDRPPDSSSRVTLLAGGVAGARGYDAVERDRDPAPELDLRDPDREEIGGAPLAAALEALGARSRVIRVSALAEGEEYARTDTLLAGLERTVDPDGDGDTSDRDRVALIGVSAPYAGFDDAPEAVAVRSARRLGTTVVAPVGHEGAPAGAYGTVGSPGAAALAVAPLAASAAVARTTLSVGELTVVGAPVLGGAPPPDPLPVSRPVAANSTEALLVSGSPPLQGRMAIVEAGPNPGARVAAAAGAGAAAVLLAEPREERPLPTLPAGRVGIPVLGVTGEAAAAVLEVAEGTEALARGLDAPRLPLPAGAQARFASAGFTYAGELKPDVSRPGTIIAGGSLVSGAAVAAARVAVEAARRQLPDERPPPGDPPPVPAVTIEGMSVDTEAPGVQFTVGSFDRGDPTAGTPGTTIVPAERLELTLVKAEDVVERLSPPGGQRGVLPGAYAFTLPRRVERDLPAGRYAFRVAAWAPRQAEPTVAVSEPFTVR